MSDCADSVYVHWPCSSTYPFGVSSFVECEFTSHVLEELAPLDCRWLSDVPASTESKKDAEDSTGSVADHAELV